MIIDHSFGPFGIARRSLGLFDIVKTHADIRMAMALLREGRAP
jgi:hypothetical protein